MKSQRFPGFIEKKVADGRGCVIKSGIKKSEKTLYKMAGDPLEQTRIIPLHVRSTCGDGIDIGSDAPEPRLEILRRSLHDMGSPLSVIRILAELLRLTGGNPESRNELIEMLDNQVAELAGRLEAVLKEIAPGNPE